MDLILYLFDLRWGWLLIKWPWGYLKKQRSIIPNKWTGLDTLESNGMLLKDAILREAQYADVLSLSQRMTCAYLSQRLGMLFWRHLEKNKITKPPNPMIYLSRMAGWLCVSPQARLQTESLGNEALCPLLLWPPAWTAHPEACGAGTSQLGDLSLGDQDSCLLGRRLREQQWGPSIPRLLDQEPIIPPGFGRLRQEGWGDTKQNLCLLWLWPPAWEEPLAQDCWTLIDNLSASNHSWADWLVVNQPFSKFCHLVN